MLERGPRSWGRVSVWERRRSQQAAHVATALERWAHHWCVRVLVNQILAVAAWSMELEGEYVQALGYEEEAGGRRGRKNQHLAHDVAARQLWQVGVAAAWGGEKREDCPCVVRSWL